jgi:hypothetical protein
MEKGELMNIFIFCLTILAMYGILRYAHKAWKRAEYTEEGQTKIRDRMEEIEDLEQNYENIIDFNKSHKGSIKKKQKTIDKFTTKE